MLVVTITSDWGNNSYYFPVLKGKLYSLFDLRNGGGVCKSDVVVDVISNSIDPFNIVQGCFVLKNSYLNYPSGSIHLMGVNSNLKDGVEMVAVNFNGHWIIAPNDGRFSLIVGAENMDNGLKCYKIPLSEGGDSFNSINQYVKGVDLILKGGVYSELDACDLKVSGGGLPTMLNDRIIGKIMYVDTYGNAISNISKELFIKLYKMWISQNGKGPYLTIYVNGPQLRMQNIFNNYCDVNEGESLAIFNSLGLLEFAINKGNFSKIEGVEVNNEVMIKLY